MRVALGVLIGCMVAVVPAIVLGSYAPEWATALLGAVIGGSVARTRGWAVGLSVGLLLEIGQFSLLMVVTRLPGQAPQLHMPWTYYAPEVLGVVGASALGGSLGSALCRARRRAP